MDTNLILTTEEILFNEAEHKYYDKEGKIYTSVTTLIGKYTDTFDPYYWGMYTAIKDHGMNVKPDYNKGIIRVAGKAYKIKDLHKDTLFTHWYNETIAKWAGINAEACMRGNAVHNELEDNINLSKGDYKGDTNKLIYIGGEKKKTELSTIHDLNKTNLQEKYPDVYNRLGGYIERGCTIFAEKRVYLREYLIAGMIDVPIIKGKYFCILDWKTNKDELHKTTGYYRKVNVNGTWVKDKSQWIVTDDRFKYPLDMLPCSKFFIYALQLSLYAYIMEQWGYQLLEGGLEIMHFPMDSPPRLLKMPYLKNEVKIMLEHHKQTLLLN